MNTNNEIIKKFICVIILSGIVADPTAGVNAGLLVTASIAESLSAGYRHRNADYSKNLINTGKRVAGAYGLGKSWRYLPEPVKNAIYKAGIDLYIEVNVGTSGATELIPNGRPTGTGLPEPAYISP